MNNPTDPPSDPSVDDGTTAAWVSPPAVRSDEGPGISDTDDEATRKKASEAGTDEFDAAAG